MSETPAGPAPGAIRVLFITVFMDLLGFGLIIPQFPFYAKACGASAWDVGLIGATYSLFQFLFSPIWGRVSDRIGRRPILILGLMGSGVSFLVFGAAFHLHALTGIGLIPILFVSRAIAGTCNANIATAQAYIADVTPPDQRNARMGIIGAAFGMGFILGPAFSGYLGTIGGHSLPFYVAGGICITTALYAYRALPESRQPGEGGVESHARGWMADPRVLDSLPQWLAVICLFLSTFSMGVMENTLGLFTEASPLFKFDQVAFSHLMLFAGFMIAFTQGFLVRRLAPRYRETILVIAGSFLMIPGLGLMTSAGGLLPLYFLMGLTAMGNGLLNPSLASLSSRLALPAISGEVLGFAQSMSSMGRILGPVAGGWLYEFRSPTTAYVMAGVVMVISTVLAVVLERTAPARMSALQAEAASAEAAR